MKLLISVDPSTVVTKTITNATVMIYFLSVEDICKQRANAMTPRIIPLNQQTFSYLELMGNGLFMILYIKGRM